MKRILAILLALVMVFALAACGGNGGNEGGEENNNSTEAPAADDSIAGTYDITVWAAEKAVDLTKQQIQKFNETNEFGVTFNATVEPVSEADAGTNMVTDVEAGGDLYCFAQDQFARLVQAGALAKLGVGAAETVKSANDAGVVKAATAGEELYAYPMTADNGYFMYYDKSVIDEADIDSLEKLIEDCEAANKYFAMEMNTSAWYLASFFFATGCVSEWKMGEDGASFVEVNDTFDSPEGLIAAKGMKKLVDSPMHLSSSKGSEFASNAAIVVTGTWDYEAVKEILGDNMGVADLPSFTVDGKEYHLGSFNGCKLMGVKPQKDVKKQAALHKLAQYLTGYECQMERFNELSWGPSNSEAQASEEVKANPGLAALIAQSPYSVPQGQMHGSWWDIAKVIADDVKDATDDAGLQQALDNYKAKIEAVFNVSDEVKNAFTVIGSINGDTWSVDLEMEEADGVWKTVEAYELNEGDEFKVRQGKSWDVAYPADNFKVEEAGTYYIQLDPASGEVTLVAE
ncbi:MAG: extracellular solute-binding protein [Clostridia bacterium]|nr:extracellular solute-binding protein [Clostridia bacterium]